MLRIKGWQTRKKANKTVRTIGLGYLQEYGGYLYVKAFFKFLYHKWISNERIRQVVYLVVSVVSAVGIYAFGTYAAQYKQSAVVHQTAIKELQPQVNQQTTLISQQTSKLSKYQISTNPKLRAIYGNLTTIFNDMYDYQNGSQYVANRKDAMHYFDQTILKKLKYVYSTGIDTAGQNMIDTLNQQGSLKNVSLYTTKAGILGTDSLFEFTAVVSFTSTQQGTSADAASHERMATYHIQWDNTTNKIVQFDQVNLVKAGAKYGQ